MADKVADPLEARTLGLEETPRRRRPSRGLLLRVAGSNVFLTHPLPDGGRVMIGRAADADVRIDEPSISRHHAVIHAGDPLYIEDLGSANGTSIGGSKIEPNTRVEIRPSEVIDLGSVMIVIQPASARGRPRRMWSHGYFEGRLEDECARIEATGGRLALGRIDAGGNVVQEKLNGALSAALGPMDVMAAYGPDEYEVLLLDVSPQEAREVMRDIEAGLLDLGLEVRSGLAIYPRDGRTPEALMAKACGEAIGGEPTDPEGIGDIIVEDEAMQRLYRLVDRIAQGTISVLLLGETGVGKEIVAEAIHQRSPRKSAPFLRLNCGGFSETLLESELFGHEKGAYTGADDVKVGLLETAQGGTVFLDEVGELPMSIQAKLLRVLEERRLLRVGGLQPRSIDVRFVSATNRDLEQEIARGRFRQDLYFRLNGMSLFIPPLRERTQEIRPLARTFIAAACRALSRADLPGLSSEAEHALERYAWPGNIRELRNFMERAVLLADHQIELEHLPMEKMSPAILAAPPRPADSTDGRLRGDLEALERDRILDALEKCAGNQTKAARRLGVSRGTLVARMEKYDLPRPRKR